MLKLQSVDPVVVDLGDGASVTLHAPSPRIIAAGRRAARLAHNDDADIDGALASLAFSEGVLIAAIQSWTGIGDANGKALECTPETVAVALTDTVFFDTMERRYVIPIIMREAEKNASAASSAGTSARATAGKGTASSRAVLSRKSPRKKGQPKAAPSPTGSPPPQRGK